MERNVPAICGQVSDQIKSANPSAPITDFTDDEIVSDSEDEYECDSGAYSRYSAVLPLFGPLSLTHNVNRLASSRHCSDSFAVDTSRPMVASTSSRHCADSLDVDTSRPTVTSTSSQQCADCCSPRPTTSPITAYSKDVVVTVTNNTKSRRWDKVYYCFFCERPQKNYHGTSLPSIKMK